MEEADASDGRWMTYGQLAEARQIGRRAAIRLAQRHSLRRQPGNDGLALVWVPDAMATSSPHRPMPPPVTHETDVDDTPPDVATSFHAQALAALEGALAQANTHADEAHKRADAALALADRTLTQLADAGTRIDRLECDLADALTAADIARTEAREAQNAAAGLREAEAARKARGRLRRAWAAWRGE
jgi:hypothetical protein